MQYERGTQAFEQPGSFHLTTLYVNLHITGHVSILEYHFNCFIFTVYTLFGFILFCCHRQRMRDTEGQLASLHNALAQQREHHKRQSAEFSKEAEAKVQRVKALQEEAAELQRQLTAQRCKFEATLLHSSSGTL